MKFHNKIHAFLLIPTLVVCTESYASTSQNTLICPAEADVTQALNSAQGRFNQRFYTGIRFSISQNIKYENDDNKAEVFEGYLTTVPVKEYQPLKVQLSPATIVVYYAPDENQVAGIKPHSYISCRYKVIKAEPNYYSSDSYTALIMRGLTDTQDGYFNFESYVNNMECKIDPSLPRSAICKPVK